MDTETSTGSDSAPVPDLGLVPGEPAHRLEVDQATELLLEMAALTRIAFGAHRTAGSSVNEPVPPAQAAAAEAPPAAIAVPTTPPLDQPTAGPALAVPALEVPPLATPPQVSDQDRTAVLQEIAFLDE